MKPAFLLLCALMLAFGPVACAHLRPRAADPLSASQHEERAEQRIQNKDYAGAAREMALAIAKAPGDAHLYVLRGSLLEALERNEAARSAYQTGLGHAATGSDLAAHLSYRLALFYLLKDHAPTQARALLGAVPADSVPGIDLQALLQLQQDQPRQALATINQALAEQPDGNETARLLYHGALAYQRLKDPKDLNIAIFRAVGLAEDPALIMNIEHFWTAVNARSKR